ncbi:MAG TPA: UDP-N-acetylmuramate--L-alanine ligase [Candidatus Moranbacteria bacterium]|nr:UDP-N-acetylmuramate--L-alanine ligase [Candidatus Moranbacteria bacterium]
MQQINPEELRKIYFVGIEGAGTSALAVILKKWGREVSGSDEGDHFYFENLSQVGISVNHSFNRVNLPIDSDLVVYSTAFHSENNKELQAALDKDLLVLSYPEALGLFFNQKLGIAVCGTHGKTTTTALIGEVLKIGGADPTVLVGATVRDWKGSVLVGQSDYFILEADEYQNKFQHYNPFGVVLTSIDYDHPDFFPDFASYKKTFADFIAKISRHGFVVASAEDADVVEVVKLAKPKCEVIFYGRFENGFEETALKEEFEELGIKVKIFRMPENLQLQLPGKHNKLNATAALAVAEKFKLDQEKIIKKLAKFSGVERRFEELGEHSSRALIFDDYAHHPAEIRATLKAAREKNPDKNIICVFHPHTFTRTQALLDDFAKSFEKADEIIVLDIYGSAREKQGGVSSADLVKKIQANFKEAKNIHTMDEVFRELNERLKKDDLVITMGAGDVWKLGKRLAES